MALWGSIYEFLGLPFWCVVSWIQLRIGQGMEIHLKHLDPLVLLVETIEVGFCCKWCDESVFRTNLFIDE